MQVGKILTQREKIRLREEDAGNVTLTRRSKGSSGPKAQASLEEEFAEGSVYFPEPVKVATPTPTAPTEAGGKGARESFFPPPPEMIDDEMGFGYQPPAQEDASFPPPPPELGRQASVPSRRAPEVPLGQHAQRPRRGRLGKQLALVFRLHRRGQHQRGAADLHPAHRRRRGGGR